MKKILEDKGIVVTNDIIEKAKLGNKVSLFSIDNIVMLTKTEMTAMEVVKLIDSLTQILQNYVEALAESCGKPDIRNENLKENEAYYDCENCSYCNAITAEVIHLPDELLKIAGIPKGTKLSAFIEENAEIIHIEPAEYEYDISDVPKHLITLFANYGICLGELDALLISGEVI